MAVTLPSRSPGRDPGRRGAGTPTAESVPQVAQARDPGVRIPEMSGIGEGLETAGAVATEAALKFQAAESRIRTRRDAVERARAVTSYNEEVNAELLRMQTEADLTAPETVETFGTFLTKRQSQLLESHGGSEESKLRLMERLEGIRGEASNKAAVASVTAQRKLVSDMLTGNMSHVAARAGDAPETIPDLFESWDAIVDDMAPALTPEEERAQRLAGRSQIVASAVQSVLDKPGGHTEAAAILQTPGLDQIVSPPEMRRIRADIAKKELAEEKARNAGNLKLAELEQIVGRPLKPEERLQAAGLSPKEGRQTLSEKIAEFEKVMGRPAEEPEIAKMAGAVVDDGGFGRGITGRSLDIMTDDAPAFAAGLLSEPEERRFVAAVTQYAQPRTFQNPDTGLMETRRAELPPFVTEALNRRGIEIPAQGAPFGSRADAPVSGRPAGDRKAPEQTVWGLAGTATGPIPAIGEMLGRTPIVGEVIRAPEMTQARQFIPQLQRDLVRVLQNNPRYAEGERKAIESEININPSMFDTSNAFRDRLLGIDQALEVRERNAFETARSPSVGREERIQAMNVLNALVQFRQNLGVPPRVKTPEEAKKLPSGSQFIDPQGNVRVVP